VQLHVKLSFTPSPDSEGTGQRFAGGQRGLDLMLAEEGAQPRAA
jgi:hypothetical protein